MLKRIGAVLVVALVTTTVFAGAGSAQVLVEVSITSATPGHATGPGCAVGPELVDTPPQFVLTRTGSTTDALEVAISWSGGITTRTSVTPSVAEFAAGSATTTVTPVFASTPEVDSLTLTVVSGAGYQVGDPATLDAVFEFAIPLCAAPPRVPPPVFTGPNFTG